MIHICFGLHDKNGNYSKYVGTAIGSLLANTQEDISIHIIHDQTLTQGNKEKFERLIADYKQKIFFYQFELNARLQELNAVKIFSIGTLFRLKMTDVLPAYIKKAVYLDADIIVNLDIKELWEKDFKTKALLARKDHSGIRKMCEKGVLSYSSYINAGVLLLNLEKIRSQYQFYQEAIAFFEKYPDCDFLDQDAINYIFKNDLDFIEDKYNLFTVDVRSLELKDKCAIYHFAGDYPRDRGACFVDQLFFKYLLKTPWGKTDSIFTHYSNRLVQKDQQIQRIRKLMKKAAQCKKIFFGTSGKIHQAVIEQFSFNTCDYYVDNNQALWGQSNRGIPIQNPELLRNEDKAGIVIIITTLRYAEVKAQLESYGYCEDEQFFDGRKLLLEVEGGYVTSKM